MKIAELKAVIGPVTLELRGVEIAPEDLKLPALEIDAQAAKIFIDGFMRAVDKFAQAIVAADRRTVFEGR